MESTPGDTNRVLTLRDKKLIVLLQNLTGQDTPLKWTAQHSPSSLLNDGKGIGYSQFNELLLLFGYDRVTLEFFQMLAVSDPDYPDKSSIRTMADFRRAVDRVRKMALLFFGNVKHGFKTLSRDVDKLHWCFESLMPAEVSTFSDRHDPVQPIQVIPGEDAYYLGYIIETELRARLEADPTDGTARSEETKRQSIVEVGKRNHDAYLASDHLDVYVATSMRERLEYEEVARFTNEVFSQSRLATLKLRWFDPTQAYCKDRVDKGLAEALMLKRARCTLYLAQETDTFGKDSELASTLAQGKPVIAYVPKPTRTHVIARLQALKAISGRSDFEIVMGQLQLYKPALAWTDPKVKTWIQNPGTANITEATELLISVIAVHYEKRANTLKEVHPLGIQVNLDTGVANGVLVARTIEECAELIERIVLERLEFRITRGKAKRKVGKNEREKKSYYLRETVSDSVFRVMSADLMLSNSFWNFYLEPSDGVGIRND